MQNVSDAWKAVQKQQLVNESYVEISFDIADPDALADATSKDNGAIYIADTAQIVSEVDKDIVPYGTLEENLWLLDGSRRFIPESNYGDNGYIGNLLSEEDGSFDRVPFVDIDFTEVHEPIIPGITITWGIAYNEYAEVFKVTAYNGSTVVAECKVEDNASVKSVVEFDIETYDSIRIEILKWCLPHHRPRIAEIFVGVNKVYGKSDITGYEHEQDINPIGATTPVNKMGFSIDNSNNIYDPNNMTGLSKYLMERQEMRVKYGLKLNDGTIEYIPAGVFYLSEWEAPQNGIEARFTARDLLEFMQKTYTKGLYKSTGATLYDLAISVLTEANLPLNDDGSRKWLVSDTLKSITTTAPLPLSGMFAVHRSGRMLCHLLRQSGSAAYRAYLDNGTGLCSHALQSPVPPGNLTAKAAYGGQHESLQLLRRRDGERIIRRKSDGQRYKGSGCNLFTECRQRNGNRYGRNFGLRNLLHQYLSS